MPNEFSTPDESGVDDVGHGAAAHSPLQNQMGPLRHYPLHDDPLSTQATLALPLGDRTLLGLSDGYFLIDTMRDFLGSPSDPTGGYDALARMHGQVRMPLGCFLLPGARNTLIDTGFGPTDYEGRGIMVGGNLLVQMNRQGFSASDIDVIGISHLHADHTGWLADAHGAPVFPNAQIVIAAGDWDYFVDNPEGHQPISPVLHAALVLLAEQGRITLMEGDGQIAPGVDLLSGPGHTPGHSLFAISDHGERAILFGDAMYCPQQLTHTDWDAAGDVDKKLAKRTREIFLRDLDRDGAVAVGCHFPGLQAGRLLSGQWVDDRRGSM